MRTAMLLASLLFAVQLSPAARADDSASWVQVDDDDGVRTWQRAVAGQELPSFRGQAVIDAPVETIRTIIEDVAKHTQWMKNCVDARLIGRESADVAIVYNKTGLPWPIWDRDVVLHTVFRWNEAHSVLTLTFEDTNPALTPLPEKTVRMPKLRGYYRLERVSDSQSRVTYEVNADVGGSLPRWLAKRAAKEMPYETLQRLRARATQPAK